MQEAKKCECGCGKMAKPGRRFVHGHNQKNKHLAVKAKLVIRPKKKTVNWKEVARTATLKVLKEQRAKIDKAIQALEELG